MTVRPRRITKLVSIRRRRLIETPQPPDIGREPTRGAATSDQEPRELEAVVLFSLEIVLVRVDLSVHLHLDEVRGFPSHGSHLQSVEMRDQLTRGRDRNGTRGRVS